MDTSTLLSLWELGLTQPPIQRGLGLLASAWPARSVDDWARQPIGRRDDALLQLREVLFGTRLEGLAACPQCGEQVEMAFSTADIRSPLTAGTDALRIAAEGLDLACRVPNSLDVLAARALPAEQQRAALMQRCIVSVTRKGSDVPVAELPETLIATLAERLAAADPQAAVELALSCPGCGHRWSVVFDILSYLWGEIQDWAQRLLLDIHTLASAYGWSEGDILAMPPRRRRMYLDLLGA